MCQDLGIIFYFRSNGDKSEQFQCPYRTDKIIRFEEISVK